MKKHYFLRVMKLTIILMVFGLIQANASIYSQTITLKKANISLTEIAREVKKQTGYVISGSSSILKETKPVSVDVVDMSLDNFLELVFNDQYITYKKEGKSIVLSGAAPTSKLTSPTVIEILQQEIDINGTVTDSLGTPISGVSILI